MSMAVNGGFSPYDIIAFVQEHAEKYAAMVRSEMQAAEDRTQLVRDIADFAAALSDAKTRGDWKTARSLIAKFMTNHPETWGGGSMDLIAAYCNTKAWDEGTVIAKDSYHQENFPGATSWEQSFHSTWTGVSGDAFKDGTPAMQSILDDVIKRLDDWKEKVTGDDKIGLMTLQADADRMKNIYEQGSNLVAKESQIASLIISNIGKG
jgi:hypothetical protein